MNDETELIPRPHRFAAEEIPFLKVTVWRMDANENDDDIDQLDGDSSIQEALLIDFSSKGLKLALPFSAKFDQTLAVRLDFTDTGSSYMGQATVRHFREENDLLIAGCAIEPPLREDEVDYLVTLSGKERRKHPRTPITGEGWVRCAGDVEGKPATMVNISKGGFCSTVSEPLTVGERVQFLTCNKKDELETVSVQIRWQTETDGGYKFGCSFCEAKAYRKLHYCLTGESALSVLIKQESTKWYVIAAAMLAMFVPPAVSLVTKTLESRNVVLSTTADSTDPSVTPPATKTLPTEQPTTLTTNKAPVTKAPIKKAPIKKAPTKKAPTKKARVKKARVKKAPVKKSPVETPIETPVEALPTETIDIELVSTEPDSADPLITDDTPPAPTSTADGADTNEEVVSAEPGPADPIVTTPNTNSVRLQSLPQPSTATSSRRTTEDIGTDPSAPDLPPEPTADLNQSSR